MHPPTSKNSSPGDLKKCFHPARPYTSIPPYLTPPLHLAPPPLTSPYSPPPPLLPSSSPPPPPPLPPLPPSASSPTSLFPSPSPTPLAPTAQFTYNQYLSQKFSGGKEEWFEIHFFHSSHDGKRVVVWG